MPTLPALAQPDPTVLNGAAVGSRYVVMDLEGPREAFAEVRAVDARMIELELVDVSGVLQ